MSDNSYGSASFESTGSNMVRSGKVTDRRLTKNGAQVKVFYADRGVESDWMPVGNSGSKGTRFYTPPPQLGDFVTTLHYPTGIEKSICLCANPTDNTPSVTPRSVNSIAMQTSDGAYFEYDPDKGCFNINGIATVYLNAKGQIHIVTGGDLDADVTGKLVANVGSDMTATVGGATTINSTGNITLTAPSTKISGNLEVTGTTKLDGTLEVDGSSTVHDINILGTEIGGGST
jgi:phage baseplate assembly protein gpV